MEMITGENCECKRPATAEPAGNRPSLPVYLLTVALAVGLWWIVYSQLKPGAAWITYQLFGISQGTHLGEAVEFFLYDTPKVLMLLTLVVFGVGILRSFFTPEKTRDILAGRREFTGNVMAGILGIVTPFCSCSAVPLFIGFVTAGVPLGVTFSFLIAAPLVSEIAMVLLLGLVGWKVAALYACTGLVLAVLAGWAIGRMKLENHVEDWVREINAGGGAVTEGVMDWRERIHFGLESVREILGRVWLFILIGIAVGAGIHGYVPEGFMASVMGKSAWWSVPFAVVLGVPMYANAAGIIPVVEALLGKGAALGTTLAFMMSVIALSLPEMVILRKVLKTRLIAVFIGVVAAGILLVGYLFNLVI